MNDNFRTRCSSLPARPRQPSQLQLACMPVASISPPAYLRLAFDVARDPLLVVAAATGRIEDANPAFVRLCGIDRTRLLGRAWGELVDEAGETEVGVDLSSGEVRTLCIKRADGVVVRTSARRFLCGEASDVAWLVVLDAPADAIQKTASSAAFPTDPLTGLPGRDEFDRRLAARFARHREQGSVFFAVLFLDLDDFKPVNDRYGHAMGDRVLAAVAARLAGGIRPGDLLSRRGGDEFTLLVDGIHHVDEAIHIAERLMERSRQPLRLDGQEIQVGVSVGVAVADGSIREPGALIAAADRAMYAAKRRGAPVVFGAGNV